MPCNVIHHIPTLSQPASVSDVVPQHLQLVQPHSSGWVEEEISLANSFKGLGFLENGHVMKPDLPLQEAAAISNYAALAVPIQQSISTGTGGFYGLSKAEDLAKSSKIDTLSSSGVITDNSVVKTSSPLQAGLKKSPVSQPSRHHGPPPGFSHVPPKQDIEPTVSDLISENSIMDDYSWLDGYQLPSSTRALFPNGTLTYPHSNSQQVSNDGLNGTSCFPFPGKQVPSALQGEKQNVFPNLNSIPKFSFSLDSRRSVNGAFHRGHQKVHDLDWKKKWVKFQVCGQALMYNRSSNIVARIFDRQICTPAPGTSVHHARRFYENLVPSYTIYEVECPDHSFRKFTDDGQYLISFSRNHQELIVYRPRWLSFSCKDEDCDKHDLPSKAKRFDGFFTQLYCVPLASCNELICKDFFLYMESNQFGLFATSTAQIHDAPAVGGAVQGVPSIEKITFHLLRLEDGEILDKKVFCNDFVNLTHNMGVFLYDDLLAIVSLRYQTIHILQIRDSGNLVDVRAIGEFCREDDELFLNSNAQGMALSDKNKQHQLPGNHIENHMHPAQPNLGNSFLSGIKQRLLSFIFQGLWNEERDDALRAQRLRKKFYFHFQDYVDLIIWKVQFLDRHHLLIKFGSVDGGPQVSRNADHHPAFVAVYNMDTTEIVSFYQNSADELYLLFEQFCDHFHATSRNSMYMNFISSHSNNIHALEQLRSIKDKASNSSQFVKKMLASLPFSCQSQSPSPYFDQSLFRFDDKLISATDRHRQSTDHPIKFILRKYPYSLKFKIKPGPEAGSMDGRAKKISSFLFHPILPLALSVQQTLFLQPSVVNIHFRR
ncbi:Six-hairpin glycosidase superfamily [Sesbania bispinosa]|nr:Six-hairpin glycosidase superfamily [Sesbania bispinosa]